jgi:hypothetical protein
MVNQIAREIVNLNISEKNENLVDPIKLSILLNKMIFNQNYISPSYFYNKTLDDAKAIIIEIFNMSIDIRVDLLGQEQSARILKDIILQNLDYQ